MKGTFLICLLFVFTENTGLVEITEQYLETVLAGSLHKDVHHFDVTVVDVARMQFS
jgi:predicted NAD/FAD-binding protein